MFASKEYISALKRKMGTEQKVTNLFAHPIMPTLYALNKSFSKKLLIGMNYNEQDSFHPTIKLVNQSFEGLTFDKESWTALCTKGFPKIEEYFYSGNGPDSLLQKANIGNFDVHFVISHGEKAIQIEEKDQGNSKTAESFKRSITLKLISFIWLKDISRSVQFKLDFLTENKEAIAHLNHLLLQFIHNTILQMYDREITNATKNDVRLATTDLEQAVFDGILDELNTLYKENTLSNLDVKSICYELISLNFDYIVNGVSKMFK